MYMQDSMLLGNKKIIFETGEIARQADGAVLVTYGETTVLATVTTQENKTQLDHFPLLVDYEERFYAGGKIPGGFFKREGRPSEAAILTARMIDRSIRPLFPAEYNDEVQVILTVLSAEPDCSPALTGMLGASAALMISKVPFAGPIAGVQIGRKEGRLVVNPDHKAQATSRVNITVAGTSKTVIMVEGSMDELSEDEVVEAIALAHRTIQELIAIQERFTQPLARLKTMPVSVAKESQLPVSDHNLLYTQVKDLVWNKLPSLKRATNKQTRHEMEKALREATIAAIVRESPAEKEEALTLQVSSLFDNIYKEFTRRMIIDTGERIDGRATDELRPITIKVGILARVHGSALFTRGETQSLATVTMGTTRADEQLIDQMMFSGRKRFMLHYNFPPYSVGEVGKIGSPSRRAVGHGCLAEGALLSLLPTEEEFPYIVRLVSEILESNGSSSMATICSGSLALMDAGVPIKKPVAGVAMGMIQDQDSGRYTILTDILGMEDHFGDMDFKVAGTEDGITAFQLDVKTGGITTEILVKTLNQARDARLAILKEMAKVLASPRTSLSKYAPRLETVTIPSDKIGVVIGPGGKMIRQISEETGAEIDIDDKGLVKISAAAAEAVAAAKRWIKNLTTELEQGMRMKVKVTRLADFGAFVQLKAGTEGLVHISNLADGFVDKVSDIVKPGDEITIEVIGVDKMGRPDLRRVDDTTSAGTVKNRKVEVKVGDIIEGTVSNIVDYGAFVDLTPEVTGLIHISALSDKFVKRVKDVVQIGDKVTVEVVDIDERGRYKLHRVSPAKKEATDSDKKVHLLEDRW